VAGLISFELGALGTRHLQLKILISFLIQIVRLHLGGVIINIVLLKNPEALKIGRSV